MRQQVQVLATAKEVANPYQAFLAGCQDPRLQGQMVRSGNGFSYVRRVKLAAESLRSVNAPTPLRNRVGVLRFGSALP